jgi:glutamate carboxypeptidase
MRLEVFGKAAHSGGNFQDGISAIGELAHKIAALHALTDLDKGTTVNVGLISGGQSVNTVAPHATGEIDLRYVEPQHRDEAVAAIEAIVARSFVPGTSARLEITGEFLPLVENPESRRLFEHYVRAAADVGLSIGGDFTGGCADSGFSAAVGAPTLCATGPVGGKAHSPDEFLKVETMVPRAQALALAILRLAH